MNDVSMGKDDSADSGVSFYPLPRNTANQEQESLHIKLFGIQEQHFAKKIYHDACGIHTCSRRQLSKISYPRKTSPFRKTRFKITYHCYIFIISLNFPSLVPLISATGNLQEDKEMNDVSMGKDDSADSGVSFYPLPRNTANQEQESLHIKLFGIQG